MPITAEIIEDSIGPLGQRLTTMAITFPRRVHAELLTHRLFSRNASSSRAIPIMRLLRDTVAMPAVPEHWGAHQKGMQARKELEGWRLGVVKAAWHGAKWMAAGAAYIMHKAGAHKQLVNRIIEPFGHITVLVTSTSWENFWKLRDHPDADPTIWALAGEMRAVFDASQPRLLKPGEWHLPYVRASERRDFTLEYCLKLSTARCARVSYLTHDRKVPTPEADLSLYERLAHHSPMHASPLEHQGTPDTKSRRRIERFFEGSEIVGVTDGLFWDQPELHGNFTGFVQHRKTLEGEAAREKPYEIDATWEMAA